MLVLAESRNSIKGQSGHALGGKTLVLREVQVIKSVDASTTLVCPHRPSEIMNPKTRSFARVGRLSRGFTAVAIKTATTFVCSNWVGISAQPSHSVLTLPLIRSTSMELLTV